MVEPIMYLAIGFLLSMLCGLAILPLVHNRAVRLTKRRIEAATPMSMAEIQADKDQLRAEFAMSVRRLEMSTEQLQAKNASLLAELGKKTDAINRMKIELDEKNAASSAVKAREAAMKEQLRTIGEEFNAKTEALRELSERSMTADTRTAELIAVRTQIEQLKQRFGDAEKQFATAQAKLTQDDQGKQHAENALLRERINDIAANVARLAMQMEGPGSPIEALLAAEAGNAPAPSLSETGGTLAQRIRALQDQASRAHQRQP